MTTFDIDPRLEAETKFLGDWPLSRVLLTDDSRFPWLVLVPRKAGAVEIFDLVENDRYVLMAEITRAAKNLKLWAKAEKMNVAALGNIVPQLHVHVVARRPDDAAGAAPVWGVGKRVPYTEQEFARLYSDLRAAL